LFAVPSPQFWDELFLRVNGVGVGVTGSGSGTGVGVPLGDGLGDAVGAGVAVGVGFSCDFENTDARSTPANECHESPSTVNIASINSNAI